MSGAGRSSSRIARRKRTAGSLKNPFLHRSVREQRAEILSAIADPFPGMGTMPGMPIGTGIFTTYPDWAEIVGGVMAVNDLGNPTSAV